MNYSGPDFSCCNGQCDQARRWARLDRCLVNSFWLANFNSIHLNYLPKLFSDHFPMMLNISHKPFSFCKIFRFKNYWLDHANFIYEIKKAIRFNANSSPMHAFYHILARVKKNVNLIKQKGLGALDKEIKHVEFQLQAFKVNDSNNPNIDSDLFKSLKNMYRSLLRQNHRRWA